MAETKKDILIEQVREPVFPFEIPHADDTAFQRKQFLFMGEWDPSEDPLKIGEKNFSVLQNYCYKDFGLEGVPGYTKITTNPMATYIKGRSGIQLLTPYTQKTYVLAQAEKTDFSESAVMENRTAIPNQGNFEASPIHTDASGAGLGRFAPYPHGHVAYCNEKESCIYGGDETRIAGFFSIFVAKIVGVTDITFSKTASPDTIVTVGGNFNDAGFKAGHQMIVSEVTHNNGEYIIVSISADGKTVTLGEDVLHEDEADTSAVITVSEKKDHTKVTDYSEAINNAINSAAQAATVSGTTGYKWLVFTIRPAKAFKYYIRTANAVASTTTCKVWDGDSFEAVTNPDDGTVSDGKSMAQTASFSFDSTVDTAKPLYFEGLYLYAYLFEMSAGSAVIYHVTVNAPFQDMVDVWDGVYRQAIQFQVSRGLSIPAGETDGTDKIVGIFSSGYPEYSCFQIPTADYDNIEIGAEITTGLGTVTVLAKISRDQSGLYYYEGETISIIHTSNAASIWPNPAAGADYTYANPEDVGDTADYNDYTLDIATPSYGDYPLGAVLDGLGSANHIIVMFEERVSAIMLEMIARLVNTNSVKISSVGYWNGKQYHSVTALCDTSMGPPGSGGALKSFNRSGVISWKPPGEAEEFRQTLFGVNGYAYKITIDGTLSGTWEDPHGGDIPLKAAKEVVIDTVKGVPAQKTIKGYKFPALFCDRPMLCALIDGKEGNRVDYGASQTVNVFNGEDSSFGSKGPLYFGGNEELTAFCQLYNRFGSSVYSTGIFTKKTETYILHGYDSDTWRIHRVSGTLGCPAPKTMDTAEVGYGIEKDTAVRNIAIWLTYAGPVIFDAGVLIPSIGEKIRKYFDKSNAACINYSAIENAWAVTDPDTHVYNLFIPSGSGQTTCNAWLCYDLSRKKWFEKVPAGTSAYPQAGFRVVDDNGAQYVYGFRDNGYMMRLEYGTTWDSEGIVQKVVSSDQIPTGDMFDLTEIRRLKLSCISISESVKITMKHYLDGSASAATLTQMQAKATNRHVRATQNVNKRGWSHKFEFSATSSDTDKGIQLLGWNYQYKIIREDYEDDALVPPA